MLADKQLSGCVAESGKAPRSYIAQAFDLRQMRLQTGEQMTVAVATDACMALGQSARLMIFQRIAGGHYRRVLDTVALPGAASANADGTVTAATHESIDVIFEATYVWNGTSYAFSALRSHRYDVALGERRQSEIPVRFARGSSAESLSGTVAYRFGDDYVFDARAGRGITITLRGPTGQSAPRISLYYDDQISSLAELNGPGIWSGKLPKTGSYLLLVSGSDEQDETRISRYTIWLAIR
jgi:hypothetical protein